MYNIVDILIKKRHGQELTWEEVEFAIKEVENGNMQPAQLGALLMAIQLKGLTITEVEHLSKAMLISTKRIQWPAEWGTHVSTIHSTGTTGNKAKLVLAPVMAACGIKFPILSARGVVFIGGILGKMVTIPGFRETSDQAEIKRLLETVGCCVVGQPLDVAPAERIIRDTASQIGVFHNKSIKTACLISRVAALNLPSDVIEVTCGPSEGIKTKSEANALGQTISKMAKIMGVRCKVLVTHVDAPVGKMIGQSLEVQEAVWCLSGDGPADYTELVCRLGGHILHEAERVQSPEEGTKMAREVIKNGQAKKKLIAMLQAQGVDKYDVKAMLKHKRQEMGLSDVLPVANYFTHLPVETTGFVHDINLASCNRIMQELASRTISTPCVGGIQLLAEIGSHHNKGETWARIHHHVKLDDNQVEKLKSAITLKPDAPLYDMTLDLTEITSAEE